MARGCRRGTHHRIASRVDRAGTREATTAPTPRPARDFGDGRAPRCTRARDDARRGRGAGAWRRVQADRDPRPAHALGLVLAARNALVQLAARARAVRRARLRRRARGLPHPRAEPFAAVLEPRRDAPARLAGAPRLATQARPRVAGLQACGLAPQIRVVAVDPVLARRGEDVDVERVLERLCGMREMRRDRQHLAGAHVDHLGSVVAELEAHRAAEHVRDLFVVVRVLRNDRALREIDLRDHHRLAGDERASDRRTELLARQVVPAVALRFSHDQESMERWATFDCYGTLIDWNG